MPNVIVACLCAFLSLFVMGGCSRRDDAELMKARSEAEAAKAALVKAEREIASLKAPRIVALSDCAERDVIVGLGTFGKNGDCGYSNRRIIVRGQPAVKGLSTHCMEGKPAGVSYDVPSNAKRLVSAVAIIDAVEEQVDGLKTCGSPITFRVLSGDGRVLWTSPTPISEVKQVVPCDVSVEGVSTVRLEAQCEGSNGWCCAVWLNPCFTLSAEGIPDLLKPWYSAR